MAGTAHGSPEALAPPPGNPRFPLFDGLRAIAALSVLVFHAGYTSHYDIGSGGLSPYIARLNVGVAVFFVISGFLLYRPLLAARARTGPPIALRDYARRRVLRIVPGYWVALTLLAVWPGGNDVFTGNWWAYYGFAQGYGSITFFGGITAAWTLGAEVVFYATLPLVSAAFGWAARRAGRRVWWQFEAAILLLLSAASLGYRIYANTHSGYPQATVFATFAWFAAGMALALLSVLKPRIPRAWLGWPLALVAYVVMCRALGLYSGPPFSERDDTAQVIGVYALSGLVAAGLALPAAFEPEPRSAIGRLLASRWLAWLGLISYGIYLYHAAILAKLDGYLGNVGGHFPRFVVLTALAVPLSVTVGAVSYYVIERPALKLKETRLRLARVDHAVPRQ